MKNLFSVDSEPTPNLPRNAVPLSFQNLFTTEFGRITPVFCKEVLPGDSFQIDGSIAIQGMPTVFPVQTRIRASLSFFYSRDRNVYDEFEDFIFKTKDVEAPWLKLTPERAKKMIKTNSLGDFFNISTTKGTEGFVVDELDLTDHVVFYLNVAPNLITLSSDDLYSVGRLEYTVSSTLTQYSRFKLRSVRLPNLCRIFTLNGDAFSRINIKLGFRCVSSGQTQVLYNIPYEIKFDNNYYFELTDEGYSVLTTLFNSYEEIYIALYVDSYTLDSSYYPTFGSSDFLESQTSIIVSYGNEILDATDDAVIASNPYVGDNPRDRLDVWKFRHYEMICNYYYRDDRNNPYYLNGEPQYNEFIPTHAGGPDENIYDFHYAPWEKDPFTTAVQSPQFGDAPLVGITINSDGSSADLVFNKDGGTAVDGATTESYPKIRVHIDDEGYIDGIGDFSDDVPSASLRKLINGIQSKQGISINDFRVTNSFQRFLENTLRRGLRYRNQLKSHFGVKVDYPDIDVPEYIGGVSSELNVSRVTNTADSPNAGLGDFVGQLSGLLQMKHKITRYIHEHGFIMGLLTLTPIPTYSQITSKDNLKLHPFDFYQTEFGKIGYVPIHYNEVCPMQTVDGESIDDVFGYQKAWYDYMFAFDEVHGDFRTNLRDFVLSRTFAERPTLVEDFVRVKPEQLNHIFVTENIADAYGSSAKFMCNAFFSVSAKRPIPVRGIPSLE